MELKERERLRKKMEARSNKEGAVGKDGVTAEGSSVVDDGRGGREGSRRSARLQRMSVREEGESEVGKG